MLELRQGAGPATWLVSSQETNRYNCWKCARGLDQLPGWSLHRRQTGIIAGAAPGGWTSYLAGLVRGDKQVQILEPGGKTIYLAGHFTGDKQVHKEELRHVAGPATRQTGKLRPNLTFSFVN